MIEINPNALYTRPELVEYLGNGVFRQAQACGLHAVGGKYLGKKILDCLMAAHENGECQRAATRSERKGGGSNEKKKVESSGTYRKIQSVSGNRGAARFLRAMEEA